jgi:hypothetical protein
VSTADTSDRSSANSVWPFVAAAAVVVIVLAAVIVVSVVGGSPAKRSTAERSVLSGHATDLVVHAGDTISGQGEVVAIPGRPVRFCAPVATPEAQTIETCAVGIDVTGVNLGRLTHRRASAGRVSGLAGLAGTYRQGTLKVTVQSSYVAPPGTTLIGRQPPCAAPNGGWPTTRVELAPVQAYAVSHPGVIVESAILRPTKDEQVAYVLTAGDPAPVRIALAPALGSGLCVARSRYSAAQLDRTKAAMQALPRIPALNAITLGTGSLTKAGQPEILLDVAMVSAALAGAVDAQPAGLVRLTAWLSPTS